MTTEEETSDSGKTILVVEDERVVAKDLQRMLSSFGYRVPMTAASTGDAMRLASERCPDLVLMDVRIRGGQDGIETAELLRKRFGVPVVYVTAYADRETLSRAKGTEPFGYLVKPVNSAELRSTVEIALYRHALETRLKERERWFATTLRSIGDAVISTDTSGRISFMNAKAEALTGWRSDAARGRTLVEVVELLHEITREPLPCPLDKALRERTTTGYGGTLIGKDGEERAIEESAAPILDEAGAVRGAVLVLHDVSEQRRLRQQLELADRLASLGTLAAGVAHEINNPLAFIQGNLEFALARLRECAAEGADARLAPIERALFDAHLGTERVHKIVSDLRAFSKPAEAPGRADARRVLGWALDLMGAEIKACAKLVTQLDPIPTVVADETRLGQVFVNLLINAVQALPAERSEGNRVRVASWTDSDGRAVVEIADNGSGMSSEVVKRIFEPFFTTKAVHRGAGLGLAVCHGIIASYGGEIQVESEPGKGSVFRVLLPAAQVEGTEEASAGAEVATLRGQLLVIDDEPLIQSAIGRFLAEDHDVVTPESASAALELLRSGRRFDLIVCDLMMPDIDGIELYEQLQRLEPEQARRVVFMTGGVFTARASAFLAGVETPPIQKPFSVQGLRETISGLLRTWGRYGSADRNLPARAPGT